MFLDEEVRTIQDQLINEISTFSITASSIAMETNKDPDLYKLKQELRNGENYDTRYSIQEGVLFKGNRVVIPLNLRK